MSDEKRAVVEIGSNVQNLGDLRKLVRLADRMSLPDASRVDPLFGKVTITAWLSSAIVPRARGNRT